MSARQPGRRRRRPPSIISRSRLQRKGPASGLFLIYCRDAAHSTPHLFAVQVRYQGIGPANGPVAASTESAPLRLRQPDEIVADLDAVVGRVCQLAAKQTLD